MRVYALFGIVAFFFVRRYVTETKGKTLEEISIEQESSTETIVNGEKGLNLNTQKFTRGLEFQNYSSPSAIKRNRCSENFQHDSMKLILSNLFDRNIYDFIDAGEIKTKSYTAFLARVTAGYNVWKRLRLPIPCS
jgi:hypothetical protein